VKKKLGKLYLEHIEEAVTEYFEALRSLPDEEVDIQDERRETTDRDGVRCYCGKGWRGCECTPPTTE